MHPRSAGLRHEVVEMVLGILRSQFRDGEMLEARWPLLCYSSGAGAKFRQNGIYVTLEGRQLPPEFRVAIRGTEIEILTCKVNSV